MFRSAAKITLRSLIVLYLLYLLPVNLILFARFLPWLASEGEGKSINITYQIAWSLIPGRVHIRHLKLNGTDPNVHWRVNVSHLDVRLGLGELLNRRLEGKWIRASDATVDVQEHRESERAAVLARLRENENGRWPFPWTVILEDVRIDDLRRVQTDSFYFSGDSDVRGSMNLRPGQELQVSDGRWTLKDGLIKSGDTLIIDQVRGYASVTIHPTDLRAVHGNQIFKTMDIETRIRSRVFDAQVFGLLLSSYRPLRFGKTVGRLEFVSSVNHGVILPGTRLEASLDQLDLQLVGASLHGRGEIHWNVTADVIPVSLLNLDLHSVEWRGGQGNSVPLAENAEFSIQAEARDLSLVSPMDDIDIRLRILHAKIGRIEDVIHHLAQEPFDTPSLLSSASEGEFDLQGRIVPHRHWFRGKLAYSTNGLRFSHDRQKTVLSAALRTHLRLLANHYENGHFDLTSADVALSDIRVDQDGKRALTSRSWKTDVILHDGHVEFGKDFSLQAALKFHLTNVALPARYGSGNNFWVALGVFLFPLSDLNGTGHLAIQSGEFSLTHFEARSKSDRVMGAFSAKGGKARFAAFVRIPPVNICVDHSVLDTSHVSLFRSAAKCQSRVALVEHNLPN